MKRFWDFPLSASVLLEVFIADFEILRVEKSFYFQKY